MGKQLYQGLLHTAAGSYVKITNLSEGLRKKLTEQEPLTHLEVVEVQTSKIDGTQKYLFQLADGNVIESVWMQYKHGNSVCISSQGNNNSFIVHLLSSIKCLLTLAQRHYYATIVYQIRNKQSTPERR